MSEMGKKDLLKIKTTGSKQGRVAPLTHEDKPYFAYLRKVFKRLDIVPSKAARLEYDFVICAAESGFSLQQENAWPATAKIQRREHSPHGAIQIFLGSDCAMIFSPYVL